MANTLKFFKDDLNNVDLLPYNNDFERQLQAYLDQRDPAEPLLSLIHIFLPALGFAMLLNMIWTREIGAFYFIGFVLSAFLGMTNTGVAILGAAFAVIAFFFIKSEDKEAAEEEVTDEKRETKRLSRKALMGVYWRAHTLETSFNYQNYQGSGYCYAMIPALKELYPDKKDLAMALSRHYEFFKMCIRDSGSAGRTDCRQLSSLSGQS